MLARCFPRRACSPITETPPTTKPPAFPIKGTVTEFIWTNPHSQIYLDVKDSSGKVVNWGVETNSPGILTRAGWTRRSLKAGDEVTIIVCPAKNGQPVAYAGSGDPGTKVIFADGRELDFADKTADNRTCESIHLARRLATARPASFC